MEDGLKYVIVALCFHMICYGILMGTSGDDIGTSGFDWFVDSSGDFNSSAETYVDLDASTPNVLTSSISFLVGSFTYITSILGFLIGMLTAPFILFELAGFPIFVRILIGGIYAVVMVMSLAKLVVGRGF